MDPVYGIGLLLLGSLFTVAFFWLWFKIQTPPKKEEINEVLKRSRLLDDNE
jgi:hypothetical protein